MTTPQGTLDDLLYPVYGKVIPALFELVTTRAVQRLGEGAPASVLEVGVRPGQFLRQFQPKTPTTVVGIDASRSMLIRARDNLSHGYGKARLACGKLLHLPFPDGSFEGVVALFVFDMLPLDDVPGAVSELARVLAPGSRAVLGSIAFSNPLVRHAWMTVYSLVPSLVGRARPVEVDAYLEPAGLRVLRDEKIANVIGTRLLTLIKVVG